MIAENDQSTFVFSRVPHRIELEFEVHFSGDYLISAAGAWVDGDFVEGDFIEAAEISEHVELFKDSIAPVGPVLLEFGLGEGRIGADSGAPGGGKCERFEALGEVCDGAAGGRFVW